MLRIKDPKKSLDFYTRILGMTWVLLWTWGVSVPAPQLDFNRQLFFLTVHGDTHIYIYFSLFCANFPQAPAEVWLPLSALLPLFLGLWGQKWYSYRCKGEDWLDFLQTSHHWADTVGFLRYILPWSDKGKMLCAQNTTEQYIFRFNPPCCSAAAEGRGSCHFTALHILALFFFSSNISV